MSIIPALKGARIVAVLLKAGFRVTRQKGSHVQMTHLLKPGKVITIPASTKTVRKGTLISILKEAGISIRQFLDLLK